MNETIEALTGKLKELAGNWASYSALGSFALYVGGYLSLRFQLTMLGVGTDLAVLDERYLFAGAKFLVYLGATIPNVVLLASLVICVFAVVIYLPYRVWRRLNPGRAVDRWRRLNDWGPTPTRLSLAGIVVSVTLIQFVMRKCFLFTNLLLTESLPNPDWMGHLLLSDDDLARSLYFSGLVAGVALTGWLLLAARDRREQTVNSRRLTGLLAALVALQLLMLPVTHGILIADNALPKVANLGGVEPLPEGQEAWLVWEGKDGVTYLLRATGPDGVKSKLVTIPRTEVKRIEIIRYDPVLRRILGEGYSKSSGEQGD
jgi:hypothetical protein